MTLSRKWPTYELRLSFRRNRRAPGSASFSSDELLRCGRSDDAVATKRRISSASPARHWLAKEEKRNAEAHSEKLERRSLLGLTTHAGLPSQTRALAEYAVDEGIIARREVVAVKAFAIPEVFQPGDDMLRGDAQCQKV